MFLNSSEISKPSEARNSSEPSKALHPLKLCIALIALTTLSACGSSYRVPDWAAGDPKCRQIGCGQGLVFYPNEKFGAKRQAKEPTKAKTTDQAKGHFLERICDRIDISIYPFEVLFDLCTFWNCSLFLFESFKRRQKLIDSDFVEIKIDPSVIIDNECIFCDTNAASHTFDIYRQNEEELAILKTWIAFDAMFKKTVKRHTLNETGKIKRFNQKPNETTCSQAEICLIGNIQPEKFINLEELKQL